MNIMSDAMFMVLIVPGDCEEDREKDKVDRIQH